MAHIVLQLITVFEMYTITQIEPRSVRHCKRKDCPDALSLRENGGQQVVFLHLHVLPQ